jgi:hypothetical protein
LCVSVLALVAAGCSATATVELTGAPLPDTTGAVSTDPTAPREAPEPAQPSEPADPSDETEPAAPSDDSEAAAGGALFELEGDLPLTTAEVNELILFIENETGRAFLRPPVIVGQSTEEFFAGLADDVLDFEAEAEPEVRVLQALGLTDQGVNEVVDLFSDLLTSPEGILGYYDPEPDKLYVPNDSLADDEFRALMVHELTHALDGQHADLGLLEDLINQGDETGNYEPVTGLQAVAEGRATSVENRWRNENNAPQEIPDDLGAAEEVPPALLLELSVPYAFGEQFIEARGGASQTWELLTDPPQSSEEFIAPFGADGEAVIDVATPEADGPVLQEFVFGASDLLVWLLGESLEPQPALIFPTLTAIDGWAGGKAVVWGDDTETCVRIAIAADSASDLAEIETAIQIWADGDAARTVVLDGDLVVATSCGPFAP